MADFLEKNYKQILNAQLERIPDTIDKREGSVIMTALGPESWYLEGLCLEIDNLMGHVYAPTAGGGYLDKIAVGHGLARKAAMPAVKRGFFNLQVPIGSRFSTVTSDRRVVSLVYAVTASIDQENAGYAYQLQCETAGEVGNTYTGQLLPVDHIAGLSSAELGEVIEAGTDGETDESLRKRLLQKIQLPSTSGNKYDYYNWSMAVTGVGAAKVFPLADGTGTVKVVIADASMKAASDSLIEEVMEYIEERRPIGATVSVVSAKEKRIDITAKVVLSSGVGLSTIQAAFAAAVSAFLESKAFGITYVSPAHIGNVLLGVAGTEDYTDLSLNGQTGNIVLADEEIAVAGNVRLGVM